MEPKKQLSTIKYVLWHFMSWCDIKYSFYMIGEEQDEDNNYRNEIVIQHQGNKDNNEYTAFITIEYDISKEKFVVEVKTTPCLYPNTLYSSSCDCDDRGDIIAEVESIMENCNNNSWSSQPDYTVETRFSHKHKWEVQK